VLQSLGLRGEQLLQLLQAAAALQLVCQLAGGQDKS
jgi:hypothetical protein